MNPIKARDFFSEYYEGTLEPGLRQAFERTMRADAQVQTEYLQFQRLMAELGKLSHETIEAPYHLHDMIGARIDQAALEKRNLSRAKNGLWWRAWAYGAVATVALVGALFALKPSMGGPGAADVFSAPAHMPPTLRVKDGVVRARYQASEPTRVVIRQGVDGPVIEAFGIGAQFLNKPLPNSSPTPALVSVQFGGERESLVVAIPGTQVQKDREGSGTVLDLAVAIAGFYNIPVQVGTSDTSAHVQWSFSNADPVDATVKADAGKKVSLEERHSGILFLSD